MDKQTKMKLLGLDTATLTGFALCDERGAVLGSGTQSFAKRRGESNGSMLLRFRKWLADLLDEHEPTAVAYEQPHFRGGGTELLLGLTSLVQQECAARNVDYMNIRATTLKKFATGKGNAGKPQMIATAAPFLGREPEDDNEADAVHVARWLASEVGGKLSMPDEELGI